MNTSKHLKLIKISLSPIRITKVRLNRIFHTSSKVNTSDKGCFLLEDGGALLLEDGGKILFE